MAHSLTPAPPPAAIAPPIPTPSRKKSTHLPSLGFLTVWASHGVSDHAPHHKLVQRRTVSLGLAAGAVLCLNASSQIASAASRRPLPPPPPEERKDPTVSGLQAKVLASKKRKEAMKESMAKLRERGKKIEGPSE